MGNRHETSSVEINGYELGSIAFVTSRGPLWSTCTPEGTPALLSLHSKAEGEEYSERWKAWALVRSARIARLLDVVRHDDGRWALIQERAPGRALDLLIGTAALRPESLRRGIVSDIREALEALHSAGLVHGDVSPRNVLIDENGRAVLVDLAFPPRAGGGTPGFSVSGVKDEAADISALEEIASALDLRAEGGPEGASADDAVGIVRRASESAVTVAARAEPSPRPLLAGILGLALVTCAAAAVVLGAPSDGGTQARAIPSSGGSDAPSCPSREEARVEIAKILAARDEAIAQADARGLEGRVGGALGAQDRERLEVLIKAEARLSGLETRAEILADPECDGEEVRVDVRLLQSGAEICRKGVCEAGPGPQTGELRLVFPAGAWIVIDAKTYEG